MKSATTWDLVCAANQELGRKCSGLWIMADPFGCYQAVEVDHDGVARANKKVGPKMDEQQLRDFVNTTVFA
jgi:hypothetical protein